jgi:hypothetical protein
MDLVCFAQWAKSGGPNPAHYHFRPTNPLDVSRDLNKNPFLFNKCFNKCFINAFTFKKS